MDQLHEELKEVTPPPPDLYTQSNHINANSPANSMTYMHTTNSYLHFESQDEDRSTCSTPSLSQSEAEYETCDSGVSEQSSLSDEIQSNVHRSLPNIKHASSASLQNNQMQTSSNYSRSPSPTSSQRTYKSTQSTIRSNRSNSVTSLNSLQMSSQQSPLPQEQQSLPDSQQADNKKSETSAKLPHRSIISDVFDGKLLSSVQCLTCDRVSTREETFQDLSLPIPGKDYLNVLHQSQSIVAPLLSPSGGLNPNNDPVSCWLKMHKKMFSE